MKSLHPKDLKKIKILHLEDMPSDAELVARCLERDHINFETLVVRNKTTFVKALKNFAFDIILSDHSLASFDSHEALRMVQKAGITAPFILVTATMNDEFAAKMMKDGADDYILKDRLSRLPLAVINSIEKTILRDKQKAIAQQLIKSEAFSLGVINSLSSHIAVIDQLGNIVAVNTAWKRFALENGETTLENTGIGSNYFKVCDYASNAGEKIANQAFQGIKAVINGERSAFYLEYPCHSPESERWFGMRVMKFESDEKMAVVSHQNITERKQAERHVVKSEKRYRQIVETAEEGIWLIDADNLTIFANNKLCEILEYTEQELMGRSILSFKDENGRKAGTQNIEKRKAGIKETYESEFITKSGKHILTLLSASPILDDDGNYNGLLSMISDITERKKTDLKLAQSEIRLTEAQAIAQMGNFEVDMQSQSEVWSDEMYKIYGITKANVIPSKALFLSFIHPDDVDDVIKLRDESLKTLHTSIANFRFIRADGTSRYGYSEARFELDTDGNIIRIFGIFQDITDAKLAEIKHTKMVDDLIIRNTDLEQFAYIISHNLRAPVANIIGASAALNDTDLSVEDVQILSGGINKSVMKLDEVVKDINQILEIRNEILTTKETVAFSDLVEDIKNSIKNLIDNENIEIKHNFSAVNELVTFKPYLYSIFYNLITNSIKYRRKEIKAVIEIKSFLQNNIIELIFADNGLGIDLVKNGSDVFGLYKRFHSGIDGKGMGLFMVKTQVNNLGGKISVTSAKDAGAVFKIEIELKNESSNQKY
jgi:PAS domain S-box-containing protein